MCHAVWDVGLGAVPDWSPELPDGSIQPVDAEVPATPPPRPGPGTVQRPEMTAPGPRPSQVVSGARPFHDQRGTARPSGTSAAELWKRDMVVMVAHAK